MSDWIFEGRYDFSIPEAQWLSDLAGIDSDLEAVTRICANCQKHAKRLGITPNGDPMEWFEDTQMLGHLQSAAVVRYGRTLTSGVRAGIPSDWIESLSGELRQAHEYIKVLRDKFIAHSVNRLEDNQVFVVLVPQFSEKQTPGHITVDRGRQMTLHGQEMHRLSELAKSLRVRVQSEMASESDRLLQIALNLSIEEIKARGMESVPVPGKDSAFKPRSRFT